MKANPYPSSDALDPPPYLFRMQRMGYPIAYLAPSRPSGVAGSSNGASGQAGAGDDEPQLEMYREAPGDFSTISDAPGSRSHEAEVGKKREREAQAVPTVAFPGLNAPPPTGANEWKWGWRPEAPVAKAARVMY